MSDFEIKMELWRRAQLARDEAASPWNRIGGALLVVLGARVQALSMQHSCLFSKDFGVTQIKMGQRFSIEMRREHTVHRDGEEPKTVHKKRLEDGFDGSPAVGSCMHIQTAHESTGMHRVDCGRRLEKRHSYFELQAAGIVAANENDYELLVV
ncbi:hypothetical protein B0H17DRAFT_1150030 [Mycena rosella]|uniref:Uncharacterized protein n=1 Tax=Mycena rosella TaxID=1033263 RepID=A0AAD7BVB7_MYCRO|nr:hypothetical protein B0H17DRAFT_1150030 [Mycena rosella]